MNITSRIPNLDYQNKLNMPETPYRDTKHLTKAMELGPSKSDEEPESSSSLLAEEQNPRWSKKQPLYLEHRWLKGLIYFSLFLATLATAIWTILTARYTIPTSFPSSLSTDCGSSVAEAKARGCHFDMMSWLWVPAECFDAELVEEFIALRDWDWYTDHTGKERVPLDIVKTGAYDRLWAPQEYHMWHCTYMWKKMHRAILRGRPMDSDIANYNHTVHCEKMLLDAGELTDVNTRVDAEFVSCSYI